MFVRYPNSQNAPLTVLIADCHDNVETLGLQVAATTALARC